MAKQIPELIPVPIVDPVATQINHSIDRLILSLDQRRHQLLTDLRDRREEISANRVARQQMDQQITETRALLEGQMTHNLLHSFHAKIVTDLEAKMSEMQVAAPPQVVSYQCDTRDLEERISRLGEIVQLETPPIPPMPAIPNYAAFQQPIVAVGKINGPRGVSIDTESGHIYVANVYNKRIQIFSETGDYINQFGHRHLKEPWGILIHHDHIYVTDTNQHAIFLFKLPDLTMVKRVGKRGSGNEEFYYPKQLAISPNQHLYVADEYNNRIKILSEDLTFQDSIRHQTLTTPVDVKFTNNELFVLSREDNPCIHVFTLSGEKSRSLVTRGGIGMQVSRSLFFCLDELNNIVISDCYAHDIKVFSPAGDLLDKIGQKGQAGMFCFPHGIAILNNSKLVCVSANNSCALQIFS